MSHDRMRDWLEDVARRHGLTGGKALAEWPPDEDETDPLEVEYRRLGGDAALLKALADEDRAFRAQLELQRARAKEWQRDRRKEFEGRKSEGIWFLEKMHDYRDVSSAFLQREDPVLQRVSGEVRALGAKLDSEPGRELLHELGRREARIAAVRKEADEARWKAEIVQRLMEGVAARLEDVDGTYEAIERRIRDSRSEVDNALELRAMSLQEKVERLRGGSSAARGKALKRLESDIARVLKRTAAAYRMESSDYEPPAKRASIDPIDWEPVVKAHRALAAARPEDLRREDPALDGVRRRYEKAGGDAALFKRRMGAWKRAMASAVSPAPSLGQEKILGEQVVEASTRLQEAETELRALASKRDRMRAHGRELSAGASTGDLLSEREAAEYQLLARALQGIEKEIADQEALIPVLRRSKENAEKLVVTVREFGERYADDDASALPRPNPRDLDDMPVKAKYAELTGRR